jgi:nucleoside-diphosphate kinase
VTDVSREESMVILKPDALERGVAGDIISRLEGLGLVPTRMKLIVADDDRLARHYPDSLAPTIGEKSRAAGTDVGEDAAAYGREVLRWNREYMKRGPVMVMTWAGDGVIKMIRGAIGHTDPSKAEKGTIRGDLGIDSISKANAERRGTENMIHASGSPEEAAQEIAIWFGE